MLKKVYYNKFLRKHKLGITVVFLFLCVSLLSAKLDVLPRQDYKQIEIARLVRGRGLQFAQDVFKEPTRYNQVVRNLNVFKILQDWEVPTKGKKGKQVIEGTKISIPDITSLIERIPELAAVLVGEKAVTIMQSSDFEAAKINFGDFKKALWGYKFVTGKSIKTVRLNEEELYVYNENILRSELMNSERDALDKRIGATTSGLELLIKVDMARENGEFYNLAKKVLEEDKKEALRSLIDQIYNQGELPLLSTTEGPEYLVMLTFERPEALDKALKIYTQNLKLFGHKNIKILIFDDTPSNSDEGRANIAVIEKYSEDFDIVHITPSRREDYVNEVAKRLHKAVSPNESLVTFTKKMQRILQARNIGSARTFSVLITGGKMFNVDDDSLPYAMVPEMDKLDIIKEDRQEKINKLKEEMFNKLDIHNEQDYIKLLAKWDNLSKSQKKIFEKYYAYYMSRNTGLIPKAAGEIISEDITNNEVSNSEQGLDYRIRFGRFFKQAFEGKNLINAEDSIFLPMEKNKKGESIGNFGLIPVDFITVFSNTLGKKVGAPEVGYVFEKDLRGTGGLLNLALKKEDRKRIALAAAHFNNARDLSAESLMVEALKYWSETNKVDIRDLQQVVRQTIHIEVDGLSSTDFDKVNQYCFNVTSMDLNYPIPTLGGWLRIEEPFYKQLVEFITGDTMAWARIPGGHRRIPTERRPRVDRQTLWEEMAMVLWPFLDEIFKQVKQSQDPETKMKQLGKKFLELKNKFELESDKEIYGVKMSDQREKLLRTRERMVDLANQFWEKSKRLNFRNVVGGYRKVKDTEKELQELAIRIAHQFDLAKYILEYDKVSKELIWKKEQTAPRKFDWITGDEKFDWNETEQGRLVDFEIPTSDKPITLHGESITITEQQWKELKKGEKEEKREIEFFFATESQKIKFLGKVQDYIRQQLEYDGILLKYWPEILKITEELRNIFYWIPE